MEAVSQTLAGRTAFLCLYPLSLAELSEKEPLDPLNLDHIDGPPAAIGGSLPGRSLWATLVDGFYPRIHDRGIPASEWLADYFRAYVERDVREVIAQISDARSFERFVRLAAAHTATELNLASLASDVGITQQTARRWLTALEIGFLATTLPSHHANYRKRLRRRPRLHFLDTGLICYLLDIRDAVTLERHPVAWRHIRIIRGLGAGQELCRHPPGPAPLLLEGCHRARDRYPDRRGRPVLRGSQIGTGRLPATP